MEYIIGFKYAFANIWNAHKLIFTIIGLTVMFEYISGKEILIKKIFQPRELDLISAVPRVYSFLYFFFCFLFLIIDAYLNKKAPDDFYYFQWLVLITPLTFSVKYIIKKIQWKPE